MNEWWKCVCGECLHRDDSVSEQVLLLGPGKKEISHVAAAVGVWIIEGTLDSHDHTSL